LNESSEEEIYNQSKVRLEEVMRLGTGAVEIKSGYGLTLEGIENVACYQAFVSKLSCSYQSYISCTCIPFRIQRQSSGIY
jgi:imidazolonepropionase-like amidohydrolase